MKIKEFYEIKDISKQCMYCENARVLSELGGYLCDRFGVVESDHTCRHFRYDLTKRTPTVCPKPELTLDE